MHDRPLPSLAALRAFECAARHGSFTRAARELCVTQTAVSHQIRQLEQELGTALFVRLVRRVELTPTGSAWASVLSDVFARLHEANRRLRPASQHARPTVSVTVLPSFASRWLVPRLGRFLEAHTDIDVRLSPSTELVDLTNSDLDLAIRYGAGGYPGLAVEKLLDDTWVLVCTPALRARHALNGVDDLKRVTLLHDDDDDAWRSFFAARPVDGIDLTRGPRLVDSSMLVEAAASGHGVALARHALAADELRQGRLVRALPRLKPMPTGKAYYLVARRGKMRAEVAAFRAWVLGEITRRTL